jgi:phage tail sheath gpL-like
MSGSAAVSISIPGYPDTNRVPGDYFVVQPNGGISQQQQRALIIATMSSAGTGLPNIPVISAGIADSQTKYGVGSTAAQMVKDYLNQFPDGELWVLGITNPTGSAGSGTITIAGTATANGYIYPYIAGQRVAVPVASGASPTTVAAALTAAINALQAFPVTAAAAAGVVTITANDTTVAGADIDIRMNYLGTVAGEATCPGLTVTIVAVTGGVANPALTTALGNLGTTTFDAIVCEFSDPTSRAAILGVLQDQSGRWSWTSELYGHALYAVRGTLSTLETLGGTVNDQHETILGVFDTPWPMYRCVADLAGAAMSSLTSDPSLPLQTLPLNMPAPPVASRFSISAQNSLLYVGISVINVNDFGQVTIGRIITTYQINAAGAPDTTYLNIERMFQIMYVLRDMRAFLQSNYARKKLVADGSRISAGSNATTAQLIGAAVIGRYQYYCSTLEICQNLAAFTANSLSQNAGNGEVKLSLPFDFANQLNVIASLVLVTSS